MSNSTNNISFSHYRSLMQEINGLEQICNDILDRIASKDTPSDKDNIQLIKLMELRLKLIAYKEKLYKNLEKEPEESANSEEASKDNSENNSNKESHKTSSTKRNAKNNSNNEEISGDDLAVIKEFYKRIKDEEFTLEGG